MARAQNKRVKSGKERYHKMIEKVKNGKSRTLAIKAKCLDCCNWSISEVKRCSIEDCPLWPYRPKKKKKAQENNTKTEISPSEDKKV